MFTEKHILTNPYNNHRLCRNFTGYEISAINCIPSAPSGYIGTTINLTPTSADKFLSWSITGAELTGSAFTITGSDVTAEGFYETEQMARYEYTIFETSTPVSAGTVSMPFSSFDEIGVCYQGGDVDRWLWYNKECLSGSNPQVSYHGTYYTYSNDRAFTFSLFLNMNNNNRTFSVGANSANPYIYTEDLSYTAKMKRPYGEYTATINACKKSVWKIVGARYQ